MAVYKTVGPCLQGEDATEKFAKEFLSGYVWSEDEDYCKGGSPQELNSFYIDLIDSDGDINIYYDMRGCYYFFALKD